jgi:hypothetical protein
MSKKAAEHHKKASEHHTHAARHQNSPPVRPDKNRPARIGGERIKSPRKLGTSSVASRHRRHHSARH